uniref:NADH dehydrogenase [ubiquinone] 1 alpha subcomplex subunit 7 n=1 Tax=Magallana gigas TaxID=29159 RepID=K1R0K2_MAGGI
MAKRDIKRPDNYLRFLPEQSPRTQPAPNLPDGPNHKLSSNYYLTRDARRLVTPPEEIMSGGRKLLADASGEKGAFELTDPDSDKRVLSWFPELPITHRNQSSSCAG